MVKNPLMKDALREIRGTLSRFISIFTIVALGVTFLAGLKTTAPDMERTADEYFDSQQLMDIRILSTLGITEEDVEAAGEIQGILAAEGAYFADAMAYGEDAELTVRCHSLMDSGINSPLLLEGRLPESQLECAVEPRLLESLGLSLGDELELVPGGSNGDFLANSSFTIVGICESPEYISYTRGSCDVGDGSLDTFAYVTASAFDAPVYSEMYLLVEGGAELACYGEDYENLVHQAQDRLEQLGMGQSALRHDDLVSGAQAELDEATAELESRLAQAKNEMDDAAQKLSAAEAELSSGRAELERAAAQLESALDQGQQEISDAQAQISQGEQQLSQGYAQAYEAIDRLNAARTEAELSFAAAGDELEASEAEYQQIAEHLQRAQTQLEAQAEILAALEAANVDEEELLAVRAEYAANVQALGEGRLALENARQELDTAAAQLELRQSEMTAYLQEQAQQGQEAMDLLRQRERELNSARAELETAQARLEEMEAQGRQELAQASQELEQGQAEYDSGLVEYNEALEEYLQGEEQGWQEIDDAKAQIQRIDRGQWYVLGRDANPGYVAYSQDADRMRALSSVLPVIFFIVAALICLTTMTRMVDEHRTQIGAKKAMGYSDWASSAKYVIYALLATLGGSVVGLALGCMVVPRIIFSAYDILYDMPDMVIPFYPGYSFSALGAALICTVGATLAAIYSATREMPASLMRPRAPAPGKRVFLERIGFIWKRLSFTHKVSVRNLLRYKKRFFMTVIGIGGCTALIITGFGLSDSIHAICDRQFRQIFTYDLQADLDTDQSQYRIDRAVSQIQDSDLVSGSVLARTMSITVESGQRSETAYELVPTEGDFQELFVLRDMDGHGIDLTDDGVIIDQKLSELLGVGVGDEITITDSQRATATVAAVNEHYAFHYIYISPRYYQSLFGSEPEMNVAYVDMYDGSEEAVSDFSYRLMELEAVSACTNLRTTESHFNDTVSAINIAVMVIIVSAALLAFVVLYNLNNINVTERIRELATIKVLGFYDMEVSRYVFRENIVLTALGVGLGLVLGRFLSQWMIRTIEVDIVMFGRSAEPDSYLKAVAATLIFSFLVNFVMHFRLKKIPMVESLKTVE